VRLPAYNDVDLHIGANYANWTIELYAKNLINKRGITALWPETINPVGSPFQATYQTPRTIGMSASLDF